jgi:zinc D-Ala-D-Ala dipeptidase
MTRYRFCFLAVIIFSWMAFVQPSDAASPVDCTYLQAVVVTTKNWSSQNATLQRFERDNGSSSWKPVGKKMKAVVGRKGLGWGRGLNAPAPEDIPVKREGDGRAPAGIFKLGKAFGYATGVQVSRIRMPYRQSLASDRCVDDPASPLYNRIVDTSEVKREWKSDEEMLRKDDQYRLGIFIEHNTNPVNSGSGSCIFFHIWKREGEGTSGCTAVSQEDMEELLRWLDPAASPILIQMPRNEYGRMKKEWGLP